MNPRYPAANCKWPSAAAFKSRPVLGINEPRNKKALPPLPAADREMQKSLTPFMLSSVSSSAFLPTNVEAAGNHAGGIRASRRGQPPDNQQTQAAQAPDHSAAGGLTPDESRVVAELTQTDRQVRAHEQAHLAAAAGLARGVSFTFVTGPDGKQYAVGGEVSIDTSPIAGNPQATIQKAQQIRAAASAPANPSGQDRAVASQASQMEQAARQELAAEKREEADQGHRNSQAASFQQDSARTIGQLLSVIA